MGIVEPLNLMCNTPLAFTIMKASSKEKTVAVFQSTSKRPPH